MIKPFLFPRRRPQAAAGCCWMWLQPTRHRHDVVLVAAIEILHPDIHQHVFEV